MMAERTSMDEDKRRRWLDAFTVRTFAINVALIATVFLNRNRWEAWVVEAGPPERLGSFSTVVNSSDGMRAAIGGNRQACLWDIESAEAVAFLPIMSFGGTPTLACSRSWGLGQKRRRGGA
jgi:hypothetical protein